MGSIDETRSQSSGSIDHGPTLRRCDCTIVASSCHRTPSDSPTVPVEPTVAGIAAGRDAVLEKAIAVLQQQIDGK
jgi:hypothetical protein